MLKMKVRTLTMSPLVDPELLKRVMKAAQEIKEEREALAATRKSASSGELLEVGTPTQKSPVKAKRSNLRKVSRER